MPSSPSLSRPVQEERDDLAPPIAQGLGRQIWSRALWDINQNLGRDETNTIILEAQFFFAPDTSFRDAALNTVEVALDLYGARAEAVVRQAFEDRGIL